MVEVKKSKAAVRMERKRERERAAGIIETTVKVPAPRVGEIRRIAKQMCVSIHAPARERPSQNDSTVDASTQGSIMTIEQINSILRNIGLNLDGDLDALTQEQLVFKLDTTRQYISAILKAADKET